MALRNQVVEAVVELVTEDAPEPLVEAELERRAHDLAHRLEAQGATIAQYLEATGQTEEQLVEELRQGATTAVKADLALRAVADAEEIEVSDDGGSGRDRTDGRAPRAEASRSCSDSSSAQSRCPRYARTSGRARRWSGSSTTWRSWTREGRPIDRALLEPGKPDADASGEDPLENAVETEEA